MGEVLQSDKDVKVQIRFIIEPFDIGIEAASKESETGATIANLIKAVQAKQVEITSAVSSLDLSKFKPVRQKFVADSKDPLDRLATKLDLGVEQLRKIFLADHDKVFIIGKRDWFGDKGPGEKAALVILYGYKYGFDRVPTYEEVNEAYEKLQFKPHSFGSTVKGNLLALGKIQENKKTHELTIEPKAVTEAETVIKEIASKL